MTLINLHVYESEIKPCPIYICTTGPVSPSAGGGAIRGRNIITSENCFSDTVGMPSTYKVLCTCCTSSSSVSTIVSGPLRAKSCPSLSHQIKIYLGTAGLDGLKTE